MLSVRISSTGENVHLCDECDALWPSGVAVTAESFVDFSTYVKPLGLRGLWNEVEILSNEA